MYLFLLEFEMIAMYKRESYDCKGAAHTTTSFCSCSGMGISASMRFASFLGYVPTWRSPRLQATYVRRVLSL